MGSSASRLDANNGMPLPAARLRPLFLRRLQDLAACRHNRPLQDYSTTSKKELLLQDTDDMQTAPSSPDGSMHDLGKTDEPKGKDAEKPKEETSNHHGLITIKEEILSKKEDVFSYAENGDDNDDDNDHERMIGHEDDEAFPGSPSFRVFFKDNGENHIDHNDIGENDAVKCEVSSNEDAMSSKESSVEKKVKKTRKRRSFRKVFPKGGQAAVKNLLNVKSCYTPCHSSQDRNHPLLE